MKLNVHSKNLLKKGIFDQGAQIVSGGCHVHQFRDSYVTRVPDLLFDSQGKKHPQTLGTGYHCHNIAGMTVKSNIQKFTCSALNLNIQWGSSHYHFVVELLARLNFAQSIGIMEKIQCIILPPHLTKDKKDLLKLRC